MTVYSIAAIAENRAIGKDNDLIWSLPDDMRFFKEKTLGSPVIMGRKNYESIPHKFRPLPGRLNIILTRQINYSAEGCEVFNDIEEALNFCREKNFESVFIIGGGEIYALALERDLVDIQFITLVHEEFDADSFYPSFDHQKWEKVDLAHHPRDEKHAHSFTFQKWIRK